MELDPSRLRGLSHPLRLRILGELRLSGAATATELGRRLGESSGSISYHVRQLHRHGFVEDVPERARGRERWWRAVEQSTSWTLRDAEPAAVELSGNVAAIHAGWAREWLSEIEAWPPEWREAAGLGDWLLNLDAASLNELNDELAAVIGRYIGRPAAEGTEAVALVVHAFPRTAP